MKYLLLLCIMILGLFILTGCATHSQEYKDINAQMQTNEKLKHKQHLLMTKKEILVHKQSEVDTEIESVNAELAKVKATLDEMFDNYIK